MSTDSQEPAGVAQLHHGDTIHITRHQIWRHSDNPHSVTCKEADVLVDCLIDVNHIIVIVVWHIPPPADTPCTCPAVLGATCYDADDSVLRLEAAAA